MKIAERNCRKCGVSSTAARFYSRTRPDGSAVWQGRCAACMKASAATYKRTTVTRQCGHCASVFAVGLAFIRSAVKRGRRIPTFCSRECTDAGRRDPAKRLVGECERCGKSFEWYACTPVPRKYCSHDCTGKRAARISKSCVVCGTAYDVIPSRASKSTCCSWQCAYVNSSIVLKKNRHLAKARLGSKAWLRRRAEIVERDGFRCTECGVGGGRLHVHHVIPWRDSKDDSPENLTTLCGSCHAKTEVRINPRHKYYTGRMQEAVS